MFAELVHVADGLAGVGFAEAVPDLAEEVEGLVVGGECGVVVLAKALHVADGLAGVGFAEAVADLAEEVEGLVVGGEGGVELFAELVHVADGLAGVGFAEAGRRPGGRGRGPGCRRRGRRRVPCGSWHIADGLAGVGFAEAVADLAEEVEGLVVGGECGVELSCGIGARRRWPGGCWLRRGGRRPGGRGRGPGCRRRARRRVVLRNWCTSPMALRVLASSPGSSIPKESAVCIQVSHSSSIRKTILNQLLGVSKAGPTCCLSSDWRPSCRPPAALDSCSARGKSSGTTCGCALKKAIK